MRLAALRPVCLASMRPRFANRGSGGVIAGSEGRGRASMRPRFANRGSADEPCAYATLGHASMRPRFANRGSLGERPTGSEGIRGFNEAPIRESGKWPGPSSSDTARIGASMRPRFANRGSDNPIRVIGLQQRASMRPRFANRGSNRYAARSRHCCAGFNEAPIRESGK